MAAGPVNRRGTASTMRAFFNNTGMVISMTLALPLLVSTFPPDQMMNMFVVGSMNVPTAIRISFTQEITAVFFLSCILTVSAIIIPPLRGPEHQDRMMKPGIKWFF